MNLVGSEAEMDNIVNLNAVRIFGWSLFPVCLVALVMGKSPYETVWGVVGAISWGLTLSGGLVGIGLLFFRKYRQSKFYSALFPYWLGSFCWGGLFSVLYVLHAYS